LNQNAIDLIVTVNAKNRLIFLVDRNQEPFPPSFFNAPPESPPPQALGESADHVASL
jgi:hypothetical protein